MMKLAISVFCLGLVRSSFLQCSPSDSLEEVHELNHMKHGLKQGVTCKSWPFYSGGFAHHGRRHHGHHGHGHSSSSEEPVENPVLTGHHDVMESHQCVQEVNGHCSKWVVSRQETEKPKHHGCGSHHPPALFTGYEMCLCADDNHGQSENGLSATLEPTTSYCASWACLETTEYPSDIDTYSLLVDNDFVFKDSSSSSSSDSFNEQDITNYGANYYRFAQNGKLVQLDESLEFKNCWCKSASINGQYCLNWFCEALAHDHFGCHKEGFGVEDYGWFGCYDDAKDSETTKCSQWYGFMLNHRQRDEYRCECADENCLEWTCGANAMHLRENYLWYNFPLAMVLWVCLCGCCGTKACFKKKARWEKMRCLKRRKCRMFLFFIVFGVICTFHGGVPALLFFLMFSTCSVRCAKKCENGKCGSKCSWSKKWECKHKNVEDGRTEVLTETQGENSVDSVEMNKTGHVRVASVDLDDEDITQV